MLLVNTFTQVKSHMIFQKLMIRVLGGHKAVINMV